MGNYSIIVPEAGTNLILNSSFEYDALGASAFTSWQKNIGTETLLVDVTVAYRGIKNGKVVTAATTNSGIFQDVTANTSASTQYTASVYARGSGLLKIYLFDSVGGTQASANVTLTSAWQRLSVTATYGSGAARYVGITISNAAASTFYLDAAQLEQNSYVTTYIDGDQPGCRWSGIYHASTSTRDAQYRLGGRERDLETTYGVKVLNPRGLGMPPVENNLQSLALQPGALYQNYKLAPRSLVLLTSMEVGSGAALTVLHQRRKSLIDLLKPGGVRGAQPVAIGYSGANSARVVYGDYRYAAGLELEEIEARNEKAAIQLLAVDPLLYEQPQEIATLTAQNSVGSNNYTAIRYNGEWFNLGTGFNALVRAIVEDQQTGRVYFGGDFTTANGVTVNGICYWNGTTFVAMGGATKGIAGGAASVRAIAVAPNGDVWVGGDFTSAGGSTSNNIAKWVPSTNTWTVYGTVGTGDVVAIAISSTGLVYVGGEFVNWNGVAAEDYIVTYNGTSWAALGTGMNNFVLGLAVHPGTDQIYCTGLFTTSNGVTTNGICYWNGTTFVAMGSGISGAGAAGWDVIFDAASVLYLCGDFTSVSGVTASRIARWSGSVWEPLGSGLNNTAYTAKFQPGTGLVYVSGGFTTAGGVSVSYLAIWNGYTWTAADITVPGSPVLYGLEISQQGDIYLGYSTTGDLLVSGLATVTPTSTADTYPVLIFSGPTTAGTSCTLQWLENQSSDQRLFFNLTVRAGETITIDFTPGNKTVTSNWRGRIYGQPLNGFTNWHLLPGANTIACFTTGTLTGVAARLYWRPVHLAVDGVA